MRFILLASLLLCIAPAWAQPTQPHPTSKLPIPAPRTAAALKRLVPLDEAVRAGRLPNGLAYYIRRNVEPRHRAELRLVVRAGSVLETEQQRGLAHFMEHMAFNGTQHFPKNELVGTLQAAGIRFGADLNAHTSYDETVYLLPVPTDSARIFRQGFQILEDWAHLATLDSVEVEKERGVVLEERRTGRGAGQRLREQYMPVLLNHARYADRTPIGTEPVLTTFRPQELRRFYRAWYRPDLMAVVAVGDFDVAQVEGLIRAQFGRIPKAKNPPRRPAYPIPAGKGTQVVIATDAEQASTVVQLVYKHPSHPERTLADLRTSLTHRLFNLMLAGRLRELIQQPNPPFLNSSASYGELLGNLDAFTSVAVARPGQVAPALRALLDEHARLRQFGFAATELARAKQQLASGLAQAYGERDKIRSATFADQYVQHFTQQAPYTSLAFYHDFLRQEQAGITLAEVNDLINQFTHSDSRTVIILAPDKEKATLPTEAQVRALLAASSTGLTAYQDNTLSTPLLAQPPTPAPVVSTREIKDLGVTEWTLQNGVRVVLKPTTFKNDQVMFSAIGPGGTSRYDLPDFQAARFATPLLALGGTGAYSQAQLRKFLSDKQVSVQPYLEELNQGITGAATPEDLPTAMQLVYSYFTQPRLDAEVVRSFLTSQQTALQSQRATPSPERVFQDTVALVLGGYNPRRRPLQPADLAQLDPARALAIYRERFANAADFTFFFVGNLDLATLRPLVETYLGGLPSTGQPGAFRDLGIHNPAGLVTKTVRQGLDKKALVQLVYSGEVAWSPEAATQLDALAEVLELKLLEELREAAGGVYSVSARAVYAKYPAARYSFRISFGCAPENVEPLIAKTQALIADLKRQGAAAPDIAKFKIETQRETELKLQNNSFWLSYLQLQYFYGDAPDTILHQAAQLEKVTVASTREAANRYFGPHYARFVLLPQQKQ